MKKIQNILLIVGVTIFISIVGIKASDEISSSEVSYQDKTVESALDELMGLTDNCLEDALCSKVSIGDYVKMTPTETSYIIPGELTGYKDTSTGEYIDQTINPSELDLWRVISINPDGTIDMVSEYVSSKSVSFYGKEGFLKFVGTLNLIANQYGNVKYTKNIKYIGYDGQTSVISDTTKFTNPAPWSSSTIDNNNEPSGGGDTLYKYDVQLIQKALGTLICKNIDYNIQTAYWLSSRGYYYGSSSGYNWSVYRVNDSGGVYGHNIYGYNNGWYSHLYSGSIRPIVTLKSNVKATGLGSSSSPWVLFS